MGQVPLRQGAALRFRRACGGRHVLDAVGGLRPVLEGGADRRLRNEHQDDRASAPRRGLVPRAAAGLPRGLRGVLVLLPRCAAPLLRPRARAVARGHGGGAGLQLRLGPGGPLLHAVRAQRRGLQPLWRRRARRGQGRRARATLPRRLAGALSALWLATLAEPLPTLPVAMRDLLLCRVHGLTASTATRPRGTASTRLRQRWVPGPWECQRCALH
mmetsp:Transcript_4202/g.10832  ORF Transcript_4202/g.10832 Transcript_4202/m.10832 type:complete len:215 (+) Transcript_4202:1010-1654(+)